jgi:hypothetical protein
MSHIFTLMPDAELLFKCGYLTSYRKQLLSKELLLNGIVQIEIDSIWEEQEGKTVEQRFSELVGDFDLLEHRDTLLYVVLLESNHADVAYQLVHDTYTQRLRDKQLAQFLMLYKPGNKRLPTNIKVSSLEKTVKLTDSGLLMWFGDLVKQFLQRGEFIPGEHGSSLFKFLQTDDSQIDSKQQLNYAVIEAISSLTIKKPNIRDRNKHLASFLLVVWNVLDRETPLRAVQGAKFSDHQIKFLFEVAEIFGWLNRLQIDSEPKDYLYSLLNNQSQRK